MKRIFLVILLIALSFGIGLPQNKLSPIWKISLNNSDFSEQKKTTDIDWKEVNLLLSWERQGYSWINEKVSISNEFHVEEDEKNFMLRFSLQCNVNEIYINNTKVGGFIPNSFWSERGKVTQLSIPESCLQKGGENKIIFLLSNLSYTGGISHNFCELTSMDNADYVSVNMNFPVNNHVFIDAENVNISIETETQIGGELNFKVNDDFHHSYVNETFNIEKGDNKLIVDLSKYNLAPGFYECTAVLSDGSYAGDAKWFAIQPEAIYCKTKIVEGFDAYWANSLAELKAIAPNFKMNKVDSLCTKSRNGYVIEMNSLGSLIIRGYYFVPKTSGPHPVVLHLPGYSYGFQDLKPFLSRETELAELALCVRGHGISADVFNPWEDQTLWSVKVCNEQENIYRSIYMDCVRAVDFLLSRPEIDKSKIGVVGGSQGGGLSIAAAALCSDNIAGCAFFDPFLSDIREHIELRTIIKSEFAMFLKHRDNNCGMDQLLHIQDLIDIKGFADKIKCPVYFEAALFDDDCPVHIGFAAYNRINSQKTYKVFPNDSHLGESGEYGNLFGYIERQFLEK